MFNFSSFYANYSGFRNHSICHFTAVLAVLLFCEELQFTEGVRARARSFGE